MNKKRLLKLADLLETDARNKKGIKFDLGAWAAPSDSGWTHIFYTKPDTVPVDCNTTACAVGLACVSGAFKRAGLTYTYKRGWAGGFILVPKFKNSKEFAAVSKFFGISGDRAQFLFAPEEYPQNKITGAKAERYVAKRIRDFVAGKVSP